MGEIAMKGFNTLTSFSKETHNQMQFSVIPKVSIFLQSADSKSRQDETSR